MTRHLPVVAVTTAVLLAAGCDSGPDHAPPQRTSAVPRSSPGAGGLELPAHAHLLVPETAGDSDLALRRFTPEQGTYTIYARCTGKGSVTIVDEDRPEEEPNRVACNGVVTVGRVYSEVEAQSLRMRVRGGAATWRVAVVNGERDM
ncbi:hypothetical protein [Streptomyces sp. NPDC019224]|uniref:hypothetical protein n=1 Tax=Streptomyces sp. NPDC019224 TaxID=3154484 RepID=UPI00340A3E5F